MGNYVTLEEVKASLGLDAKSYADTDIEDAIDAAEGWIEEETGRIFYPGSSAQEARKFWPMNAGYVILDDLCVFTSLADQSGTWALDQDFYLEPLNATATGRPYTAIRSIARPFIYTLADTPSGWAGFDGRITVTGQWGWATTPRQIKTATKIYANRLLKRIREAPLAVVGMGIDGGAVRLSRVDPDIAELVEPFTKNILW